MSADHDAAAAAHEPTPAPQHVVETVDAQEPAALALPTPSLSALLASPHLQRRGNGPVRQAAILQLQRTHGNRALQRLLKAQQTANPAGGNAAARTLQRQPAAKQQEAPADQSGMETYLWVLDDVLDNHTRRLISNLGKYQEPFEKLFQALAAHDLAGKPIAGRQQREYFDEAVLGLAPILAHATAAQRAFLQRKRDALFQTEAFDRVENTAVVEGKAVEIPDDRHPHEQAEALRAVLPHLIENAQIANEQLLHLGHDQLEHALHELEEEGHGNVMSKLAALQTILGLANGWLTLTDEELQREINTVHGFFPTVTNFSELVKAIIEVGAGAVGVTALVAAAIAKAAGDAALASSALWVAGEAGHALGNLVSGVEIVHGILVLLDPHATHAEKAKGAFEAATGSAWFLGKRAAGAAGGLAATAAVILTYMEMQLAAYLYFQGAIGISAVLERESFERIEAQGGTIARAADHLAATELLLNEEKDHNKAAALAGAEAQYKSLLATAIAGFLESVAAPTTGHGLGSTDSAGFPGNNELIVEAFAPLQRFRGVKEAPELAEAANAILPRIGWVLVHAGQILAAPARGKHIADIENEEAAAKKKQEGGEE